MLEKLMSGRMRYGCTDQHEARTGKVWDRVYTEGYEKCPIYARRA